MLPSSAIVPLLLLVTNTLFLSTVASDEVSVVSHPSKLVLPAGRPVDGSQGLCNRVIIRGFSRLHKASKYANALKVTVSVDPVNALFRIQTTEICFHKNFSIGVGMCSPDQWQKLSKPIWTKSMSPYEDRILDIRTPLEPSRKIELSTEEEFLLHRLIFLVLGAVMMVAAHTLSESVVFYYGGAMTLGIIVVVLIILFQGMKLLPTGRKSSLAIVLYSSIVGVGTFLLTYISGLLRTFLVEMGVSEDMHNPLGIFVLICLVLAGAWFGYWAVRKLVLTEEGLVDYGVAYFVEWSIWIFSAALILESSLDTLFAAEVLGLIMFTVAMTKGKRLRFLRRVLRRMYKRTRRTGGLSDHLHQHGSQSYNFPVSGSINRRSPMHDDDYYSTIHRTPVRRFSKKEWDNFTTEQTNKGLTELVSSPEFQRWAMDNVERLHVTPTSDRRGEERKQRRFFRWF
ncbi:uncharacterized protein LOC122029543 [Zingiber officinale]|uniref:uncharacterized protein LOC122029543 n=1 Tax=Zingiber officinale TaxID=94328 RepID=UPI001C4B545A|nr:uncharacterized protein LOC122029543 [Zingiber officinale]